MDKREKAIKGGIASGLSRQTPGLLKNKAEAIRLHVELDYGIQAIATRTDINKGALRRWLIAAGVYRVGHRGRDRRYGGLPKREQLVNWEKRALSLQREAWRAEWVKA